MFAKIKLFLSKIGKTLMSQTGINIATVLISLTALFLPFISDEIKSQETMQLYTFQPDTDYKFRITENEKYFTVPWQFKVLLVNTSSNVITIVNFDSTNAKIKQKAQAGRNLLTDVGFLSDKNEKVELPIILEPGKAITLKNVQMLTLPLESIKPINDAYMIENGQPIFNQDLTYYELLYYSVRAQQDIFNNKLSGLAIKNETGIQHVQFDFEGGSKFPKSQPEYIYTFTSAKQKDFKVELMPYLREEPSN